MIKIKIFKNMLFNHTPPFELKPYKERLIEQNVLFSIKIFEKVSKCQK
jgi:hypothetical protein